MNVNSKENLISISDFNFDIDSRSISSEIEFIYDRPIITQYEDVQTRCCIIL
jgi:hypothetical protein